MSVKPLALVIPSIPACPIPLVVQKYLARENPEATLKRARKGLTGHGQIIFETIVAISSAEKARSDLPLMLI